MLLPPEMENALIVVVDDTAATRYAVVRSLTRAGFRTLEAASGLAALEIIKAVQPDLITMDIHLPDMSGFEVCRKIKADPETSHIPVLQISASYVTAKDRVHGLEGGADSYLTHPVEPPVLVATIRSLLRYRFLSDRLRRNQDRLKEAVEIAKLGTWEMHVETQKIQMSARACEIFGFQVDESLNLRKALARISREDREKIMIFFRQPPASPAAPIEQLEFQLEWDGQQKWIRARGQALLRSRRHGQPEEHEWIGTVLDFTEQKLASEEMHRAKILAEQANQAKSQFLANISHEIRTPLGIIMGFTDLLMEEEDLIQSTEAREFLNSIKRNTTLLSKLIEGVLDLSKVEANRMSVETLNFSLIDLIEEVVAGFRLKVKDRGLDLRVEYENAIPRMILSDPTKIQQILNNLVGNAVKFTEQGSVTLKLKLLSNPVVDEPVLLQIDIRDHGVGLSPEQAERLFEAFAQADNSTTRKYGGTGLGLMLSRKLAQLLGGNVVLQETSLGHGSTFRVTIQAGPLSGPLHEVPANQPLVTQKPSSEPLLASAKILIVEDSEDNRYMLTRLLQQSGAAVETAHNGAEGVQKALADTYDLIIMDIQMPIQDGHEATLELRRLGYDRPIVGVTAHAMQTEKDKCLRNGFSAYLTKPVHRQSFLTTIQQFLKK